MLNNVRCVDATVKHFSIMSNKLLCESKGFAEKVYQKGLINNKQRKFNYETTRKFYGLDGFYKENGEIFPEAKIIVEKNLQEIGLKKNATMKDLMNFMKGIYK